MYNLQNSCSATLTCMNQIKIPEKFSNFLKNFFLKNRLLATIVSKSNDNNQLQTKNVN